MTIPSSVLIAHASDQATALKQANTAKERVIFDAPRTSASCHNQTGRRAAELTHKTFLSFFETEIDRCWPRSRATKWEEFARRVNPMNTAMPSTKMLR